MTLELVDQLYNERQDGELSNERLKNLYEGGAIRQWTYERLLSIEPDENDEDGSEFEGEDDEA